MSKQHLAMIKQSIEYAIQQEKQSGDLQNYLSAVAPNLHRAIALPESNPDDVLLEFVVRYIKQVPEFLEALSHMLTRADIEREGNIFIQIAEEFFIQPPELINQNLGLKALIDEAYLAHRLLEEINDRLLMLTGCPLTPMDMTLSNIIVHDLIGEAFANELDLAVHFAIESLFNSENHELHEKLQAFVDKQDTNQWRTALNDWSCMAGDSAISLDFQSGITSKAAVH